MSDKSSDKIQKREGSPVSCRSRSVVFVTPIPADLRGDILAGATIAAFSIPGDMAYASLAGLPPQTGLYASVAGMIAYAFFCTSRTMVVSVTSAISIMVVAQLATLGISDPSHYLALADCLRSWSASSRSPPGFSGSVSG